jgi:23S rRNA (cytidine1920-2'-O)/16S rRNA (cytidine1409-2'-O)-methyltransferase
MPHFVTFQPTMVKFFFIFLSNGKRKRTSANRELPFFAICDGISQVKKAGKLRADELVVTLGLCESRTQAQAYILAGKVKMGTERIDKSSRLLPADAVLSLERPQPYVGRGGLKMENFLKESGLEVRGLKILDLGASTGGFTDCLLQRGATHATCIDVGHGQLHYKLRTDARVTNLERTNLRHLSPGKLADAPFKLVVMDLSFISLRKVLSQAWSFVQQGGWLVALVKPQFECTKKEADQARGVIRDNEVQQRTLEEIINYAEAELNESRLFANFESSPRGTDGNLEFFLGWEKKSQEATPFLQAPG